MFYSGIDQHKRDSYITTYGPEGAIVKHERISNTPLQVQRYFAQFAGPHRAVVESTGSWYWLADVLDALGVELVLAHATRLKAISAAKVKTDRLDSDVLALLLRADLIPPAHMIAPDRRGPRDVMRTRLRLIEKRRSAQNSIARLLEKFNVVTVDALADWYQAQATCHHTQIALLDHHIRTLEAMLHPVLLPDAEIQRLLWIPGIGKVNAFTIYTEIDGITRFPSAKQFCSYCCLVPRREQLRGAHAPSLRLQSGQSLSQAGVRACRDSGHAILPRDPRVLSRESAPQARPDRAHGSRARARPDCLSRIDEPRRLQWVL